MNLALWIVAGVLALWLAAGGVMKLMQPREKLAASGFGFVEDFSDGAVKMIGVVELLGAIGLVLPAAADIVPVLVPVAAVGVVLLMFGAMVTHARRREPQGIAINVLIVVLAGFIAWGRFGPHAF